MIALLATATPSPMVVPAAAEEGPCDTDIEAFLCSAQECGDGGQLGPMNCDPSIQGTPFDVGGGTTGGGAGTAFAECSALGAACAGAAALYADGCVTGKAAINLFPDADITVSASTLSASGAIGGWVLTLAGGVAAANIESYKYVPENEGYRSCYVPFPPTNFPPEECTNYAGREASLEKLRTDSETCEVAYNGLDDPLDIGRSFGWLAGASGLGGEDNCHKANAVAKAKSAVWGAKAAAEGDTCDLDAAVAFAAFLAEDVIDMLTDRDRGVPTSLPGSWTTIEELILRTGGTSKGLATTLDRPYDATFEEVVQRPLLENVSALASIRDEGAFKRALNHLIDGGSLYIASPSVMDSDSRDALETAIRSKAEMNMDKLIEDFEAKHRDEHEAIDLLRSLRGPMLDDLSMPSVIVIIP